uniref:Photoreceptor cilium actin regulator n=1 Tax=Callorhinchus milii TaxID=7868 RepID=A0A4W3GKJ2_CALMI
MGCTPSQSGIIQHITRTTLKPLKKTKSLMPPEEIPSENFTRSLEEGSSNCTSDSESNLGEEEICHKVGLRGKREGDSKSLGCSDPSPRQGSAGQLELNNQGKKAEKLAAETEVAKSEQIILEKYVTSKRGVVEAHSSRLAEEIQQNREGKPVPQQHKKTKKPKGLQSVKQTKNIKTRAKSEDKVEFPDVLVQSHQAAYAFLNPSLSKYETILTLTEQATQTQLILQQMVSFLAFRFEEVNQALEEIVIGGEKLVKRVGDNLTWPTEQGVLKDQPDLLQQLLQYTVNKMQAVNGTVALVTGGALQETCGYLQSATDIFQEKLKTKQQMDDRLQRLIAHLEARATQRSHSAPDMTLYSEDSGIGADNDSLKEYCILDKYGRRVSCDVNAYPLCTHSHQSGCPTQSCVSNAPTCSSKSHDCAVERRFKDIFYASNAPRSSLMKMGNSFDSNATTDAESLKGAESMDLGSLDEEDTNESDTETIADGTVPRRPSSTPIEIGSLRSGPKRIDNPENEEMTIKLKDAISGRIQFVPIASGTNTWSDEESKPYPVRPSTANICKTTIAKQKRSRSAESLRSKAEDPTLLELQRTQKNLSKRLDKMFQAKENNKAIPEKKKATRPRIAANTQSTDQATPNSKLKASLNKNFSILPNPDRVLLKKNDQGNGRQQEDRKSRKSPVKAVPAKHNSANAKESQTPKTSGGKTAKNPHHKSVKKLIDTFSQGNDNDKSENPKAPVGMKRAKQLGVLILPHVAMGSRDRVSQRHVFPAIEDLSDQQEPVSSSETLLPPVPTSECQEGFAQDEEEMESFPPPPSNVSLESLSDVPRASGITAATPTNPSETADKRAAKVNFIVPKKTLVAQKLRASLNSVDVLPSRNRRVGAFRMQKRPEQEMSLSNSSLDMSQQEHMETHSLTPYRQTNPILFHFRHERLTSPPVQPKYLFLSMSNKQASPPTLRRQMSPPVSAKMPSPPTQKKQASPPTQSKIPSPPSQRKQTNLLSHSKFPSPTTGRREVGPGPYPTSSSPPISPRMLHRGFRHSLNVGEEPQASMRIASNVSSIFCPSSDSMFEAKSSSPPTCFDPVNATGHSQVCILGDGSPMTSRSVWRNSFMFRQYGDQQRRSTLSGVYPQPFVKRNFASDCRAAFPLQLPVSISASAGSEPTLCRTGLLGSKSLTVQCLGMSSRDEMHFTNVICSCCGDKGLHRIYCK